MQARVFCCAGQSSGLVADASNHILLPQVLAVPDNLDLLFSSHGLPSSPEHRQEDAHVNAAKGTCFTLYLNSDEAVRGIFNPVSATCTVANFDQHNNTAAHARRCMAGS